MTGPAVLVTGAASGIGAAIAGRFAAAAPVIGFDLNPPQGNNTPHGPSDWIIGDVADPEAWTEARILAERLGGCGILILNAARPCLGTVVKLSPQDWLDTFTTNVFGAALALKAMLPPMIAARSGSVVAISSVNAHFAEQGLAAYNASKAALTALIRTVAVDHAHQGIRANVIQPGTVDTPAFRRVMDTAEDPVGFMAARTARNPIGRILHPDEIAEAAVFLSSPAAAGMTGSILTLDGGLTAAFDHRAGGSGYRADEPVPTTEEVGNGR